MTLYTSKMKAKESNDLIASTLSQDYDCKGAIMKKTNSEFVYRVKFNYRSKATVVYVISIGETVKLDAISRAYEKWLLMHGRK